MPLPSLPQLAHVLVRVDPLPNLLAKAPKREDGVLFGLALLLHRLPPKLKEVLEDFLHGPKAEGDAEALQLGPHGFLSADRFDHDRIFVHKYMNILFREAPGSPRRPPPAPLTIANVGRAHGSTGSKTLGGLPGKDGAMKLCLDSASLSYALKIAFWDVLGGVITSSTPVARPQADDGDPFRGGRGNPFVLGRQYESNFMDEVDAVVRRVGNSIVLRIPKRAARRLGLIEGRRVRIRIEDDFDFLELVGSLKGRIRASRLHAATNEDDDLD